MNDDTKYPVLRRQCPMCDGPVQWCGLVPMDGCETHPCDELVCTKCNVNFNMTNETAEVQEDLNGTLQWVADKWNGEKNDLALDAKPEAASEGPGTEN